MSRALPTVLSPAPFRDSPALDHDLDPRMAWHKPVCFMCGKNCTRKANTLYFCGDATTPFPAHATCLDNNPVLEVWVAWKKALEAAIMGRRELVRPTGQVRIEGTFL